MCGSTLFIAKTREFFFEGDTGIGGLGCFSCGAKGKENFIMDRERIVEDVGDMDDYFDYEQPLDFVSRAERRNLLKETGGDEEAANQLLIERSGGATPTNGDSDDANEDANDAVEERSDEDVSAIPESANAPDEDIASSVKESTELDESFIPEKEAESEDENALTEGKATDVQPTPTVDAAPIAADVGEEEEIPLKAKKENGLQSQTPPPSDGPAVEDLDALGMDDF